MSPNVTFPVATVMDGAEYPCGTFRITNHTGVDVAPLVGGMTNRADLSEKARGRLSEFVTNVVFTAVSAVAIATCSWQLIVGNIPLPLLLPGCFLGIFL